MPFTFSCTDAFSLSYFLNTRVIYGNDFNKIRTMIPPSTGIHATNIHASDGLTANAITTENTIIRGTRTAIRMIMLNAF